MPSGPFWILEATHSSFKYDTLAYSPSGLKVLVLHGTQNKRRLCNRSRLLCKLLCHLVRVIQQIQQIQWCLLCPWQIGRPVKAFGSPL